MDEIKAAIIAAIVSIIVAIFANKYNYRQLFAQTVSSNRMDWINVWRENISKFLSCAEILHKSCQCSSDISEDGDKKYKCMLDDSKNIEKEMYTSRNMVLSRLNMHEQDHVIMGELLINFDYTTNFENQRNAILELTRDILKIEWERVKKEARGKKKNK